MKKKIFKPFSLLILIGMILTTSFPVLASGNSYSLTIHRYALEDMTEAGLPNNGKTADVPDGAAALEGIEFTIWQVDTSGDYTPATAIDASEHLLEGSVQTGITNSQGEIQFSSLSAGIYYVEESGNTVLKGYLPCEAFLVSVPMTDTEDNTEIENVHVYPKSQSLLIDKFVGEAGNADYDSSNWEASKYLPVAEGTSFGWSILSSIPSVLGSTSQDEYVVTDILNDNFSYVAGSVKVYGVSAVDMPCSSGILLTENSDYTLTFDESTNTLKAALTSEGMSNLRKDYADASINTRFLLIKFNCQLKSNAPQGVHIFNGATLKYTRGMNTATATAAAENEISVMRLAATKISLMSQVAEEPAVHTGQISITKLDSDDTAKTIAGAEFGIAVSKEAALNGSFIATGTTDEKGRLVFKGLQYGKAGDEPAENTGNTAYWLVESKSPEGYTKLEEPIKVDFHYQQDEATGEYYFAQVEVYNKQVGTATTTPTATPAATQPGTGGKSPGGVSLGGIAKLVKTGDVSAIQLFVVLLAVSFLVLAGIASYRVKKSQKKIKKSQKPI